MEDLHISPRLEKRNISIVLGTGAENLDRLGFKVRNEIKLDLSYSVFGRHVNGHVTLYDAEVGGVPVYLVSRHGSDGPYTPAYFVDHQSNMLALVDDKEGAGAKVILGSSLVGGFAPTGWKATLRNIGEWLFGNSLIGNWKVGDIVLVRDGINRHPENFYVDGNQPYMHALRLFDEDVSNILLERARKKTNVRDGGIYYSGPETTRAIFETPAEMGSLTGKPSPNLVGMTLVREACHTRSDLTRRTDGYQTKFAGFAVISDFPQREETEHGKNVAIAQNRLPVVMEIFADAIPEIDRRIRKGSL